MTSSAFGSETQALCKTFLMHQNLLENYLAGKEGAGGARGSRGVGKKGVAMRPGEAQEAKVQ